MRSKAMRRPVCSATILRRLRSLFPYLNQHEKGFRSTLFEELAVQSVGALFGLPFFDDDTDDHAVPFRATWRGSRDPMRNARGCGPDGIVLAHQFDVTVEATMTTSSDQWAREFASALRHAADYAGQKKVEDGDLYVVLIVRELHVDTFRSLSGSCATNRHVIIPFELDWLATTVETSLLARTLRHMDLRRLFRKAHECLGKAQNLEGFRSDMKECVSSWQREVLDTEKAITLAIKSYEAIVRSGRPHMAQSDLLLSLMQERSLQKYFHKLSKSIDHRMVAESLRNESLAAEIPLFYSGECIYVPVPLADFRARSSTRLSAVEQAHQFRGAP